MNGDPPPPIAPAPTSVAAFVGPAVGGPPGEPVACASFADFERGFGASSGVTALGEAVRLFFANGGTEARVVRAEPDAAEEWIEALGGTEFNLLNLAPAEPTLPANVLAEAAQLCRARRAMLIAEPPAAAADPEVATEGFATELAGLAGEAVADTAIYFPRLLGASAGGSVAAGGAVAGLIARVDAAAGVWKAPGGTSYPLLMVDGPAIAVDAAGVERLADRGVNCVRSFAGVGTVVWGARTLAGATDRASEWKYVPVRRIALHIEESLNRGLAWAAFEPNDEALWARVTQAAGDFLHSLWRDGAFQGDRPQEGYFVRCDSTTMTPEDIESGRLVVLVGFAALKPAEFVVIRVRRCRVG